MFKVRLLLFLSVLSALLSFPARAQADSWHLHSLPGSSKTIYLDFDGQNISGTAWDNQYNNGQPFYAEPFDAEGTVGFSAAELTEINGIWQRVAEDFAPFDVDVTTEDPGAAAIDRTDANDQVFGTRVLITNTTTIFSGCNCTGLGFVGVFDSTGTDHPYYQPAFVFNKGLGSVEKNLGEVSSHEAGHNLGLSHDGTTTVDAYAGQGPWAPIMGAAYYHPITQWSKGEYANANNKEDDFGLMQANGLSYRADDVGNSTSGAKALGTTRIFNGLITTDEDVDVFSFTATGRSMKFTITPAPVGPNLDIKLELLNASGVVVATANPAAAQQSTDVATGLMASITKTLSAGKKYMRIQGIGAANAVANGYSGYGSVGQYKITIVAS